MREEVLGLMQFQQTIGSDLQISGQTLHRGLRATMRILPGPADTGILFRRSDLPDQPSVKADVHAVIATRRSVTIGRNGWQIGTIEHLMAVFHGLGIDNALVEVDGPELPAGDGSGRYFAGEILKAGLTAQNRPRRYTYIQKPSWVERDVTKPGDPWKTRLIAFPANQLEISYTYSCDKPIPGTQFFSFAPARQDFLQEIAPARTIAYVEELKDLRRQGLALSEDANAAVLVSGSATGGYLNALRFPEEIVRHKILDLIGDIYLLGPVIGRFVAIRSGHALNLELAQKVCGATDCGNFVGENQ